MALRWARDNGYRALGLEVRLPNCGYRADVVAYRPSSRVVEVADPSSAKTRRVREPCLGATAVFECKRARADLLRDSRVSEPTLARLRELDARRSELERLLGIHYPSLRKGDSLFAEFDAFDPVRIGHRGYQQLLREISALKNYLYAGTKFERLARYRCANLFYLVVEDGIMQPHEIPSGWGLLVHRQGSLEMVRKPLWHEAPESQRLLLLQRIAITGSRRLTLPIANGMDTDD